jgi:hypothetical protein
VLLHQQKLLPLLPQQRHRENQFIVLEDAL